MGGRATSLDQARAVLDESLNSGAALEKFKELIKAQGGDPAVVDTPSLLPTADEVIEVHAKRSGWVSGIDALALGTLAMDLGAGRRKAEDSIDHGVGVTLDVRVGSHVQAGDRLGTMHQRVSNKGETSRFIKAFSWSDDEITMPKLIEKRL